MKSFSFKNLIAVTLTALSIVGCGGGGDNPTLYVNVIPGLTNPTTPTAPAAQLTGKAIDGYLANAKVCIDTDNSGTCDAGEVSTTTTANGDYALEVDGKTVQGKKLLVVVTPATKDLSRPAGFSFPAEFTLTAVITSTTTQHVTPLTTMVAAQVDAGKSLADANAVVSALFGTSVNTNADYIANNDTVTATKAAAVVNKLTEVAQSTQSGKVTAETTAATMNAVVAKGDVAAVTPADVTTQVAQAVTGDVNDPLTALATPAYVYDTITTFKTRTGSTKRQSWQYIGSDLVRTMEKWTGAGWVAQTASDVAQGVNGTFYLKSDNTWSAPIAPSAQSKWTVQKTGGTSSGQQGTVTAVDQNGLAIEFTIYQKNVGGTTFDYSLPGYVNSPQPLVGKFGDNSVLYGLASVKKQDVISVTGYGNCGAVAQINDSGIFHCNYIGNSNTTYTSVEQVVNLPIPDTAGYKLVLLANGQAQVFNDDGAVRLSPGEITWTKHSTNKDIIVIDIDRNTAVCGLLAMCRNSSYDSYNSKVVVVLRNGRLQRGLLEYTIGGGSIGWALQPTDFDNVFASVRAIFGL